MKNNKNPPKKLDRHNNSVTNISYHIIWITKYRKKLLHGLLEDKLKQLLFYKSNQIGIKIKAIECDFDHIHLFILASPFNTIAMIVKNLKGFSSYHLRKEFIKLHNIKTL